MKRTHAALVAAVLLAAARAAEACPACTTRSSGGYMIPILLGAMILTPYLVTTVVLRVVRKAQAAERAFEDSGIAPKTAGEKA